MDFKNFFYSITLISQKEILEFAEANDEENACDAIACDFEKGISIFILYGSKIPFLLFR